MDSSYLIIISSRAQKEIEKAWNWYEERQTGLGDKLVQEVFTTISKIKKVPDRYAIKYKYYREVSVPVFPYIVIYRFSKSKKSVHIVSIFHTSLNPKKKY